MAWDRFVNQVAGTVLFPLQRAAGCLLGTKRTYLVAPRASPDELRDLTARFEFFRPPEGRFGELQVTPSVPRHAVAGVEPVLLFGTGIPNALPTRLLRKGTFDVDYRRNPADAWEWCLFANYSSPVRPDIRAAHRRLVRRVTDLRAMGLQRAYVFGTGPSLGRARDRTWDDGYRIVCNTIVRDVELWHRLQPHFIVAGDANYHFAGNAHARAFRRDLKARLNETPTLFVYPAVFHELVRREYADIEDRLVPIPLSLRRSVPLDLCRRFRLPGALGNVLPLLLLPLGCTLAREVCLWGFDGRAPKDQFFWSNSDRHSYPEMFPELTRQHPAFFAHHVPNQDPRRYVRAVHGEALEAALQAAERRGWRFVMMHRSWTPTLQKRYPGATEPAALPPAAATQPA